MTRFRTGCSALLALAFASACAKDSPTSEVVAPTANVDAASSGAGTSDSESDGPSGGRFIAMRDDCAMTDPGWNVVGGCSLRKGTVTFAEFNDELDSPVLAPTSVIGHPSWRNDPSYLVIKAGRTVRVRNEGGRTHTFTKVAEFGGGKVPNPALNKGLATAPECPGSQDVAPGGSIRISGLASGNHRFQCCIHPWMRAVIEVKSE